MSSNSAGSRVNPADCGLTLLEVLFAFLIIGIFMASILPVFVEEWRGTQALKNHLEAHYAVMTAGQTLAAQIRSAQSVEWISGSQTLTLLPLPSDDNLLPVPDSYFIADLDKDGIRDLYWKHSGANEPLASHLAGWECVEVEPGLWSISLEANLAGQKVSWRSSVRRRLHGQPDGSSEQQDM